MRPVPRMVSLTLVCFVSACGFPERATRSGTAEGNAAPALSVQGSGVCDDDCSAILSAGVQWLVDSQSFARTAIVLDTARSGVHFAGAGLGVRRVPILALGQLASVTGIAQGAREVVTQCTRQPLGAQSCHMPIDKVVVVFQPPQLSASGSNSASVVVYYDKTRFVPEIRESRSEHQTYVLTLDKDARGWRVTNARLIERS